MSHMCAALEITTAQQKRRAMTHFHRPTQHMPHDKQSIIDNALSVQGDRQHRTMAWVQSVHELRYQIAELLNGTTQRKILHTLVTDHCSTW